MDTSTDGSEQLICTRVLEHVANRPCCQSAQDLRIRTVCSDDQHRRSVGLAYRPDTVRPVHDL